MLLISRLEEKICQACFLFQLLPSTTTINFSSWYATITRERCVVYVCYRNAKPLIYCNYRLNCFEFTQDRHYRYFPTFINYWIKIVSLCKKAFMFLFSDNKWNKIEENTIACECQQLWEYAEKMIRLKNKNWKTRFGNFISSYFAKR